MKDGHQLEFPPPHPHDFTWRRLNWLASQPYFLLSSLLHSLGHCPPFANVIARKFLAEANMNDIWESPQNPFLKKKKAYKILFRSIKCIPLWL